MTRFALVTGASRGIGLEITRQLLEQDVRVLATCRDPSAARDLQRLAAANPSMSVIPLDVTEPDSLASAFEQVSQITDRLHLVLNVAGVLHGPDFGPERKVEQVELAALQTVFAVNAFGPILLARHALPFLRHDQDPVLASLSARVGSIEDNGRGGWYAYRAAKAAQNQLLKTLSIELRRRAEHCAVVLLHPGTVDTDLSKPFQKFVPDDKLFPVERAARQLLGIVGDLSARDTGRFIAWDGSDIPW